MRRGGAALDLPGPLPDPLTAYLRGCPVRPPGLFRKLHKDYYGRIEALKFTVQHDDGQRPAGRSRARVQGTAARGRGLTGRGGCRRRTRICRY
ncbi:MAG: kinase/pyrophosphorylase [candidate division NC10 bacterium]|nr:kinase/pyrophosphorylase [candidate division NC10 bacterium]